MLPALVVPPQDGAVPFIPAPPAVRPRRSLGMFAAAPFGTGASESPQGPPLTVAPAASMTGTIPVLPSADFGGTNFGGNGFGSAADHPLPASPADPFSQQPLGGSMRQPFDYDAAMKALTGDQKQPKAWQYVVAGIGDALSGRSLALPSLMNRRKAIQQRRAEAIKTLWGWQHQDYARQNDADLRASEPFTIGRDRVSYDPASGQVSNIYHGPAESESYAQSLGLKPGTPEYDKAVQDYVLRASGPTALQNNETIDDYRTGNNASLEQLRQGNRVSLENLRQGNRVSLHGAPTYRDTHALPPTYHDLHPTPRVGRSSGQPTATGPNGQQIHWNGSAWVDANGNPVK